MGRPVKILFHLNQLGYSGTENSDPKSAIDLGVNNRQVA